MFFSHWDRFLWRKDRFFFHWDRFLSPNQKIPFFITKLNKETDISHSSKLATNNKITIKLEITLCLIISIFIFSFLLSFTIALYSLILLTPIVRRAGIKTIFCKVNPIKPNNKPFPAPTSQ